MSVVWFVSANNQLFGPYSHALMRDYVVQRRVGPKSLVRMGEAGPFIEAQQQAALAKLFEVEDTTSAGTHREDRKVGRIAEPAQGIAEGQVSNFVVIVDLRSASMMQFEAELKKTGRVFRLNPMTWLLQSELTSNAIKTTLAPYIGAEDPLLIVDAGRNRMAWHNFGVFEASSVRDLWKLPHERG